MPRFASAPLPWPRHAWVARESVAAQAGGAGIVLLLIAVLTLAHLGEFLPGPVVVYIGAVLAWFAAALGWRAWRARRPSAWRLAWHEGKLWVNPVSPWATGAPAAGSGEAWVIEPGEVGEVRAVTRCRLTWSNRVRQRRDTERLLEIRLHDAAAREGERAGAAAPRQSPVEWTVEGLRVRWRGADTLVSPDLPACLRQLEQAGVTVGAPEVQVEDLTAMAQDRRAAEDAILGLLVAGKNLEAIKVARRTYGLSLAEARAWIDGLAR